MKLAIDPTPKPRMTQSDRWRTRPATDRYWAFKDEIQLLWRGQPFPETVRILFTVPMPASWSKKKRAQMVGQPHQSKPDIDNYLKALMDALLDDDAHIWDVHALKVWGESGSIIIQNMKVHGNRVHGIRRAKERLGWR
jgi:Holliday junction resolvase RusA-like endonuclease